MKKLLLLFTILVGGVMYAQNLPATERQTREVLRKGPQNKFSTKGSPYYFEEFTHGEYSHGIFGPVSKVGLFQYNASTGEILNGTKDKMMLARQDDFIMFKGDVAFVYLNGMWLKLLMDDDSFIYLVRIEKRFVEGSAPINSYTKETPNKWSVTKTYYKLDSGDRLLKMPRKEVKKLKLHKIK